ncbi:MAG: hypothetical protein RIR21_2176, partial [Pseudomonadota bacterium]
MRRLLVAALGLLVLSACEKPARENTFFPLADGLRWVYKVETRF